MAKISLRVLHSSYYRSAVASKQLSCAGRHFSVFFLLALEWAVGREGSGRGGRGGGRVQLLLRAAESNSPPPPAVGVCLEARSGQGEEAEGGPGLVLSPMSQKPHSGRLPCPPGTEKVFLDSFYYFLAFVF